MTMSLMRPYPSVAELSELFACDGEAGVLIWKKVKKPWLIGKPAGSLRSGYMSVTITRRRCLLVHRVLFKMVHGWEPQVIDHIDGDRLNNRIVNLRPATISQNTFNQRPQRHRSLPRGVQGHKQSGRVYATIKHKGQSIYLGRYATAEQASAAYQKKAAELFGSYLPSADPAALERRRG